MNRPAFLLLLLLLGFLATSFLGCTRRSETMTVFVESTGRNVPGMVQYYDRVAAALDQYLTSLKCSATAKPAANGDWEGTYYVAQQETWYQCHHPAFPAFYVKITQPTEIAAGINVYVCWQASGSAISSDYIQVHACAVAFSDLLTLWWERYKRGNPRPDAKK